MDGKAIEIPLDTDCGLTINAGRDGIWFHFTASTGLYASFNIDAFAAKQGIIGRALHDWCSDRWEYARAVEEKMMKACLSG